MKNLFKILTWILQFFSVSLLGFFCVFSILVAFFKEIGIFDISWFSVKIPNITLSLISASAIFLITIGLSKAQNIENKLDVLSADDKTRIFGKDNNIYKYFVEHIPKAKKSIDIARFNINKDDIGKDRSRSSYYKILSEIIKNGECKVSRIYRLSNMNDYRDMERDFYKFSEAMQYKTYCFVEKKSVISLPNMMIIDKEKLILAPQKRICEEKDMVTEDKKVVAVMDNYMDILKETALEIKKGIPTDDAFKAIKLEIEGLVPVLKWNFEEIVPLNNSLSYDDLIAQSTKICKDSFGFNLDGGWENFNRAELSRSTHIGTLIDTDNRVYGIAYYYISDLLIAPASSPSMFLWENSIFMVNSAQGRGLANQAVQAIEVLIGKQISYIGCITQHPAMFARYLKFANGDENTIFSFNKKYGTQDGNEIEEFLLKNIKQINKSTIPKYGKLKNFFKGKFGNYSVATYNSREIDRQKIIEKQEVFENELKKCKFQRKLGDAIILISSRKLT